MDFESYAEAMLGPMYRDRCGNPITMGRWMDLKWDHSYVVVGKTVVGSWQVSTAWLGIDHNFLPGGVPKIFETMVFELAETQSWFGPYHASMFDDFQARYSTDRQAREGHEATVREVRKLFLPAVIR
jgi:hypothetical protein